MYISPLKAKIFRLLWSLKIHFQIKYDAGRDRGQEEKGMTEDEMAGWHH